MIRFGICISALLLAIAVAACSQNTITDAPPSAPTGWSRNTASTRGEIESLSRDIFHACYRQVENRLIETTDSNAQTIPSIKKALAVLVEESFSSSYLHERIKPTITLVADAQSSVQSTSAGEITINLQLLCLSLKIVAAQYFADMSQIPQPSRISAVDWTSLHTTQQQSWPHAAKLVAMDTGLGSILTFIGDFVDHESWKKILE